MLIGCFSRSKFQNLATTNQAFELRHSVFNIRTSQFRFQSPRIFGHRWPKIFIAPWGVEIRDTNTHNFSSNNVSLQVRVFHFAWSTCRTTKMYFAGYRKLLRKVERGSTFGSVAHFLSSSQRVLDPHQANQPISALHFFNRKCFCCATSWSRKVKNTKYRTKNCNETMLPSMLKVFVSRISPSLLNWLSSYLS